MRKFLFSCTVLTAGLVFSSDAHAQTAVIDSANLAQNVQTAAQAIVAVEQLKEQLAQLEQTYQMLTNPMSSIWRQAWKTRHLKIRCRPQTRYQVSLAAKPHHQDRRKVFTIKITSIRQPTDRLPVTI
jgi:hypothetical protein